MAISLNTEQSQVASIFIAYFGRAPEFEAMQHYVGALQDFQADPATADNAFNLLSAQIYADGVATKEVPAGPTVSDEWYVSRVYQNILGRAPDDEGFAYWVAELENGNVERAELVGVFINAALTSDERDALYVSNRTEVAVEFAQWENSNPNILPTLKYNAAEVLIGVNEDPATVEEALGRMESAMPVVGDTFTLTSGIDTFVGSTLDDTFNAVYQSDYAKNEDGSTLTPFDSIDGNLGRDTLNIYVAGEDVNGFFPATASVKNVEVVNVYGGGNIAQGEEVGNNEYLNDVSNYEGIEEFWQIDSASSVINVGEGVAVGLRDMDGFGLGVELAAGVTAAQVVLDNIRGQELDLPEGYPQWLPIPVSGLEVGGAALDTVVVEGEIAEDQNVVALSVVAGSGVRSLTVTTQADVWLSVELNNPKAPTIQAVDMSASTGDIFLGVADDVFVGESAALTVTFGSGDDTIVFDSLGEDGGRDLTLRDNIDGGEGYNTLMLGVDGKLQTQTYDAINRTQNFQQLILDGEAVSVDAAQLATFDSLVFTGEDSVTVQNLAATQAISVVNLDGPWDDDSIDLLTLTKAGANVELNLYDSNLELEVLAGDANVGDKGATLTVSGPGTLVFNNAVAGKFATIDASALDAYETEVWDDAGEEWVEEEIGGLWLVSKDFYQVILEGEDGGEDGEDTEDTLVDSEEEGIVGAGMSGSVAETVLLSLDTQDAIGISIAFGEGAENSSTLALMDVIDGFNLDEDDGAVDILFSNLDMSGLALLPVAAADDTLQLAFAAAAAQAGADEVVFFYFGGDTYLFANTVDPTAGAYDAGDFALKIVGQHDLRNADWQAYDQDAVLL